MTHAQRARAEERALNYFHGLSLGCSPEVFAAKTDFAQRVLCPLRLPGEWLRWRPNGAMMKPANS